MIIYNHRDNEENNRILKIINNNFRYIYRVITGINKN